MGQWAAMANLPFTPSGHVFFSPVTAAGLVYLIDQEQVFYSLNMVTGAYTELTSPGYGSDITSRTHGEGGTVGMVGRFYRMITMSPNGTLLAVPSEGEWSASGSHATQTGGARRIEFYDISGDSWTASKQTDFLLDGVTGLIRSLVWEDNDILWCWTIKGSRSASGWANACVKYVKGTDTFTLNALNGEQDTATSSHGRYVGEGGMAISTDKNTVYCGGTAGSIKMWWEYDVGGDSYAAGDNFSPTDEEKGCFTYNRQKLYFFHRGTAGSPGDCRIGRYSVTLDTTLRDVFTENTARDDHFSPYLGVSDAEDALVQIGSGTAPEVFGSGKTVVAGVYVGLESPTGAFLGNLAIEDYIYGMRIVRGRESELGYAPAGVAEILLDNSQGDFSPENVAGVFYPNLDLGLTVTLSITYDGTNYAQFKGKVEKIVPRDVAGDGGATAFMICTDLTDDLVGTIIETPLLTNAKTGVQVAAILDDAAAFVGDRDLDDGITTFDVLYSSGITALGAIRELEDQERGRFFIDVDGDAQWEDRHHRINNHKSTEYDFGTKIKGLEYEWSKRDLFNRIQISGIKYTEDPNVEYLWGVEAGVAATAIVVPANGSVTVWARLSQVLGAITTPLSGTHWDTNTEVDKSGANTSTSMSLALTKYSKSLKMVFTSSYGADSFLVVPDSPPEGSDVNRTAIIMGKLYQEDVVTYIAEDSTSQGKYGKKGIGMNAPHLSDPDEMRTLSDFMLAAHANPAPNAIRATIHGRTDWPTDDILKQALSRKISDRVTLASTLLGFDQDFYIEKVVQDWKQYQGQFDYDVTWVCSRASVEDGLTWLLDDGGGTYAGFAELGEATYLSY